MSIAVTENRDSQRILDAMDALSDRQAQAEIAAIKDFQQACVKGDANSLCQWAPRVADRNVPRTKDGFLPTRRQTLAEVMTESLDYRDGPTLTEAMQLILNASNGTNVQEQARGLIDRMATTWAKFNTEVEA